MNPRGLTLTKIPAVAAMAKRLHVAMIAPPYFDIPPTAYGGVEVVVADLVDALIDRGHRVTLIGAAGTAHVRSGSSPRISGSPRTT